MLVIGDLNTLKATIAKHTKQYRHNNDTSRSLFHPEKGFVYACDINVIEQALDEYEKSLPQELNSPSFPLSEEDVIIMQGSRLVATTELSAVRQFAQRVITYLIKQRQQELTQRVVVPAIAAANDHA